MTPEEIRAANEHVLRAYRMFFASQEGLIVLVDLMAFCKFRTDAAGEIDEGKRRVFLRILQMSQLPDEELIALYGGYPKLKTEPQDE